MFALDLFLKFAVTSSLTDFSSRSFEMRKKNIHCPQVCQSKQAHLMTNTLV